MPKAKSTAADGPSLSADEIAAFQSALNRADDAPDATVVTAQPETDDAEDVAVSTPEPAAPAANMKRFESPGAKRLGNMFSQDGGAAEPMDHIRRSGGRHIPWGWVLGGLGVLAAAAVAGFFFFNRPQKFTGEHIIVSVVAPTTATSGNPLTLTVSVKNNEPVDIVKGEVTIEYPDGFTYQSSSWPASNQFHNAFSLGKLSAGKTNTFTITGILVGAVDASFAFPATATFRPANFNSDFQAHGTGTVAITASAIKLTVDGPTQSAPGATATWTITYTNTSPDSIAHLQLTAVIPDQLQLTQANPPATNQGNVWDIRNVAKNGTGKIVLTGTVKGSVGDSLSLVVRAGVEQNGSILPQDEQTSLVALVKTGVTTTIAVNGSTTPAAVAPGTGLNYVIQIANQGDTEVTSPTITATMTGAALDPTQISNPDQATVKGTVFTWTKTSLPALASLTPGQSVTLHLSVGTISTLPMAQDSDKNQQVTMSVAVASSSLPTAPTPVIVATKLATVLHFTADARYYNDQSTAVGSGPVPPVVGKTTTYHVTWSVTNTTNDASAMTISATLPTSVFWTGQNVGRDAGDITFDPSSRTVTWTLNTLPAGTGSRLPMLRAGFDVSITPTADQVANVVVLTNTANAAATDSFTTTAVSATQPSLTTAIPNDPKAQGNGLVQAAF